MMPIEVAKERMREQGLKYTDKRKMIIEILAEEKKYLSAKEIQEKLEEIYPSISQDTIYRNLHLFSNLEIAETIELNGEKLFQFSCTADGDHHHHFICTVCGETIPFEMCPMTFFENQLTGCRITSHRFDIFGECENCIA